MNPNLNWWILGPLLFATFAWTTFIVWYWLRAKWWKNVVGVNSMVLAIALLLVLIRLDVLQVWPHIHQSTVWGFFLYTGVGILAIQRTYLMEMTQRRVDERDSPSHPYRRWDDPK
jgi:hypothetical protein